MYNPSEKEIAELKAKHGDIFKLTVGDKCAIMKTPDRKILSFATKSAEKDPLAFNEALLKNCFVAGDTEIRDDDAYFLGASQKLSDLVQIKESSLVKL